MNSRHILMAYDCIHRAHGHQYSCSSTRCVSVEKTHTEHQMSSSWTESRKQHISSKDLNWILHVKLKDQQIRVPKVFRAAARGTSGSWMRGDYTVPPVNFWIIQTLEHLEKLRSLSICFGIKCITLQPTITTTTKRKEEQRIEQNRTE